MLSASELTVQLFIERDGLLLHLWTIGAKDSRNYVATVDLKEKLDLSEEQAAELLAKLNAQADERTMEAS